MRDWNEFDDERGRQRQPRCVAWTELVPDAAEGLLNEAETRALEMHVAACASCAQELADARRGVAWLGLLKDQVPQPPPGLLGNILARTTGAEEFTPAAALPARSGLPASPQAFFPRTQSVERDGETGGIRARLGRWLGFPSLSASALQPRLTMTAAMAFLSICLTLNLLGVPVHNLQAETLRSAGLQRAVAGRSASLLRSFQGIRTVYRVESRVSEWLTASAPQDERPAGPAQ